MNFLYQNDLPSDLILHGDLAVDTEATGLRIFDRDRLCVVQISDGKGDAHLVQFMDRNYDAPNLKKLLSDQSRTLLFHYGRYDIAALQRFFDLEISHVFCSKIASKLVRTYTDKHGLKDLTRELLGIELSKEQQCTDWQNDLSDAQVSYAASDVLHLHALREKLTAMLEREGRIQLAQDCFDFLPKRVALDAAGWEEKDIFAHR